MRMIELWLDPYGTTHWEALRAKGALSFICGYRRHSFYSFKQLFLQHFSFINIKQHRHLLSLLKILCRMGLTLNTDTSHAYCYKLNSFDHNYSLTDICSSTFLEVLLDMFDMRFGYSRRENKECYVSEWLCIEWTCAQRNDWTCLHIFARYNPDGNVHFRILRQLLALGLFRDADNEQFWSALLWRLLCRDSGHTGDSPVMSSSGPTCGRVLLKATVSAAAVVKGDPPSGRHERLQRPHGDSSKVGASPASAFQVCLASERDGRRRCASIRPMIIWNLNAH